MRADDLEGRLRSVETAASDAEHDPTVVLTRPTLFDAADSVTARYLAARQNARRLLAASGPSWVAQQAVDDLERAWRKSREEAERVGTSRLPPSQRVRLRRARRLLERARGDRGAPALRLACFYKAVRLLEGIVVLPDALRRELHEAAAARHEPSGPAGPGFPTYGWGRCARADPAQRDPDRTRLLDKLRSRQAVRSLAR